MHVIFEPLDFIAKLAALVPKPRLNLTRFHGVFAPNSKYRVEVKWFCLSGLPPYFVQQATRQPILLLLTA
jgi:hypothetical protein